MYSGFNPQNHFWIRQDNMVYSSALQTDVSSNDARYIDWLATGNYPTPYPKDEQGNESAAELQAVLDTYGLRAYAPTLDEAKVEKLRQIIVETESAILAGFDYEIDGQMLHFSYQYNDQQNFADSNNMAMLGKMGVPGVPDSVTWNGWQVERDAEGKEFSRSLVEVQLASDAFIALYTQGALAHKAKQMAIGTQRKARVEAATTMEELEAI